MICSQPVREYLLGERQVFNDLLAWKADVPRMPYRMHSEYLRQLYVCNDLAEGRYQVGGRPVALWAAGTYAVTFALEAAGVATGAVFGPYGYGATLGPKVLDVPVVIGFNWTLVVLGGVSLAGMVGIGRGVAGRTEEQGPCPVCLALAAGAACVILDIPLEPVAKRYDYWEFYTPAVPLQNYIAWFLIAALSAFTFASQRCRIRTRLPAAYFLIQLAFFVGLALVG